MSGVPPTTSEGQPIRKGDVVVCRWDDDSERESPFAPSPPPPCTRAQPAPIAANRGRAQVYNEGLSIGALSRLQACEEGR